MSYILDALRKSDQQRQRGATPTLLTPQAAAPVPERRGFSMVQISLAAILIGAGIVIGALRPWQGEQPDSAQAPAKVQVARAPVVTTRPEPTLPSPPAQPQPPAYSEQPVAQMPAHESAPTAQPVPAKVPSAPIPAPAPQPAAVEPQVAVAAPAVQEPKVMTMAELPFSIQREIPNLSISVHAYSRSSQERLLGVNNRMLHEGDQVAPGLVLESITPDGMILSYKGYRFWHGPR